MDNSIIGKVKKVIDETRRIELDEITKNELYLQENLDLIDNMGFDSFLMVQLVVGLESEFDIEFDMETMDMSVLRKYDSLIKYIKDTMIKESD